MKKFPLHLFVMLFTATLFSLPGCTYHGKIHRGIYSHKDFEEKINARVMVVSDKYYPDIVTVDNLGQYTYRISDGLPVAVADALANLFTEVDVNEYRFRQNYDFIAEIDYAAHIHVGPSRWEHPQVMLSYYTWEPTLTTSLRLTIRNPKTGYAVARYEDRTYDIVPTYRTDVGLWFSRAGAILTLGLLSPLDIQVFGSKMRRTLERGIDRSLHKNIMPDMKDDRINFTREHETEKTNTRVDGRFIPFMQATVYLMTENSLGSGFFISPDGYILTNAHVVDNNRDVGVILYDQRNLMDKTDPKNAPDRDRLRNKVRFARVLKINKKRDLALLKMEGENFPWLELETNRKAYTTGRQVAAIGAPRAIEWSVAEGIISAVRDNNGVDTIQTDTAINGGNSGGPLIDVQTGKVVGINSWGQISNEDIVSLQRGTHGLNFAISAFEAARTLGISQPLNPDHFPHPNDATLPGLSQTRKNYVK